MKQLTIYGHSDDLIELRGAIDEELTLPLSDEATLRIGEFLIHVEYDGEWYFHVIQQSRGVMWEHLGVGETDKYNDYTEVLRIDVAEGTTVEKL